MSEAIGEAPGYSMTDGEYRLMLEERLFRACPYCGEREDVDEPHDYHAIQAENAISDDEA